MPDASGEKKPKNILVCCDGTGNKFIDDPENEGGSNSNVVKFYTALEINNEQVGYYHPGVGTADDPRAKGKLGGLWSRIKGLAFASGFKDNVLDAYRFLMETYDDGDQVYLIGFSRGAYTVRALSGLLDGYGLLCRGNQGHLPYAWNAYVKQHDDRDQNAVTQNHAFKETFSRPRFRVRFMGLWDTVSSVGWVNTPLRLFNVAQSGLIDVGRHAVSIDERRCFYRDNLWGDALPGQDLLQVWFPGVHSDVGGSYPQRLSGLSNVTLAWMLGEAEAAGAKVKGHMTQLLQGEPVAATGDAIEDARIAALKPLYPKPDPAWWVHRSMKGAWWLLELLPHRYYDKDDGNENWRTPLGLRRRIPTREMKPDGSVVEVKTLIHRSAKEQMEAGVYAPANVRGGASSLTPTEVEGQPRGSLCLYEPPMDPKPTRNEAVARWAVMIGVSVAEVVLLGLLGAGVRAVWRRF